MAYVKWDYPQFNPPILSEQSRAVALPAEMLQKVLSYLKYPDLVAASGVCRLWRILSLDLAKPLHQETSLLNEFAKFLGDTLQERIDTSWFYRFYDPYPNQKRELWELASEPHSTLSIVPHVQNAGLEKRILKVLKELNGQHIDFLRLKNKKNPKFKSFKRLLHLVDLDETIQSMIKRFPHEYERSEHLSQLSKELVNDVNIDEALTVIQSIPWVVKKIESLENAYFKCLELGYYNKAIEIAKTIPEVNYREGDFVENRRHYALYDIMFTLKKKGDVDKTLELAYLLPRTHRYFDHVCEFLVEKGFVDLALELAKTLPDGEEKERLSLSFSIKLAWDKNFDRAEEIAKTLQNPDGALSTLSLKLNEHGDHERAIEIACSLSDIDTRRYVLEEILKALLEKKRFELAIEVANLMPVWAKSRAFYAIDKALVKSGNSNQAIEHAKTTQDIEERSKRLNTIASELLEMNAFEKAIEVTYLIPDQNKKEYALRRIAVALKDADDLKRAKEVAESLSDGYHRREALKEIAEPKRIKYPRVSV